MSKKLKIGFKYISFRSPQFLFIYLFNQICNLVTVLSFFVFWGNEDPSNYKAPQLKSLLCCHRCGREVECNSPKALWMITLLQSKSRQGVFNWKWFTDHIPLLTSRVNRFSGFHHRSLWNFGTIQVTISPTSSSAPSPRSRAGKIPSPQ